METTKGDSEGAPKNERYWLLTNDFIGCYKSNKMDVYENVLALLQRASAVDEAKKKLAEADREPDILQRFIKRGKALKELEEAEKRFFKKGL